MHPTTPPKTKKKAAQKSGAKKPAFSDDLLYSLFAIAGAVLLFFFGYSVGKTQGSDEPIQFSNFYTNGTHYIVFTGRDGVTQVVNYTLDSLKQQMVMPAVYLEPR